MAKKLVFPIFALLFIPSLAQADVPCTYRFSWLKYSVQIIDANGTHKKCAYMKDIRIGPKDNFTKGEHYAYEFICEDGTWAHYVSRDGYFSSGYPGLDGYCSRWTRF